MVKYNTVIAAAWNSAAEASFLPCKNSTFWAFFHNYGNQGLFNMGENLIPEGFLEIYSFPALS